MNIEQLYRRDSVRLYQQVRSRFRSSPVELVEDACQQTWMLAWRNARPVNFAWLYVVACHEALRLLEPREQLCAETPETPYRIDGTVEARDLLRTIASLRPLRREALADRMAGLSYDEAKEKRRQSYRQVNRHLFNARAELKERLAA